jgi:hypothetical protein
MEPQFVQTEFGHGKIAGSDYGSRVRVLMRSPTAVLFTGVGLTIWSPRGSHHSHHLHWLTSDRVTKEVLTRDRVIAGIDKHFGEGAHKLAQAAWVKKGQGTVLVDGGGEPLALPFYRQREISDAYYAEHGCVWKADLTGRIKTCRQCGKPLTPDTDHHRLGFDIKPDHPRTVEDCQRLTNREVIAIHGFGTKHKDRIGYVSWFEVWDGETYHDEFFCHGSKCAEAYGRRAVREREALEVGVEAPKNPYRVREDVEHGAPKEPVYIEHEGQRIRLE